MHSCVFGGLYAGIERVVYRLWELVWEIVASKFVLCLTLDSRTWVVLYD